MDLRPWIMAGAHRLGADLVGFTRNGEGSVIVLGYQGAGADLRDLDKTAMQLAEQIRGLGHKALVLKAWNGGSHDLRILARDAGLGWIGRNGLLITTDFGPDVRLSAITVDATIETTTEEGCAELCQGCRECEEHCPSGAISQRNTGLCETYNESLTKGKCTICIDICPLKG